MLNQLGNKKSLTQQIEDELTDAIRRGDYLPGEKLPTENELCEIFNVSRTSIREAVKRLSALGIVKVKRGSGVYVSEMSIKNTSEILNMFFELSTNEDVILQTIEARLLLEPQIAVQVAKTRTEEQLEILKSNMKAMEECSLENKKREIELDNDFHRTLLLIVNNKVLSLLLSPIFNLMPKFKMSVFAKPLKGHTVAEDKIIMLNHHNNILNAIIEQNEEKAAKSMIDHINETRKNYFRSID
ncbi:FadR/GntR family transcriptional regulator [uncultured Lutibacter sp.]|uniref:FadR/GntR family transcriptional regulator n=1 Tax=uncultured Lutibacter sp. TaxID=437739 RepID=UPI00262B9959|nr:FadR/GntR family transcriptional regulator [uncultured Lutibacter sp.]